MERGDLVLHKGETVTVGTVALLAALGRDEVHVHRSPRVAILSTGNELRGPDRYDEVRSGLGVPESNGPMVAAAVENAGGVPSTPVVVPDDPERLQEALAAALEGDAIVTIGGASMGEADLVKRALDALGYQPDFWRVRMRPGTPFGFGCLPAPDGRCVPVFGLPGNPASAFVTFETLVRPFLLAMGGHRRVLRKSIMCRAGEKLPGPRERTFFLRVTLSGEPREPTAHLTGHQGSGLIRGLAQADGLARVPESVQAIPQGDSVEVLLLNTAASRLYFETPPQESSHQDARSGESEEHDILSGWTLTPEDEAAEDR